MGEVISDELAYQKGPKKKSKRKRISAPEGSTRTYGVYQIFTGDLSEGILSNVKWGKMLKLPEGAEIGK